MKYARKFFCLFVTLALLAVGLCACTESSPIPVTPVDSVDVAKMDAFLLEAGFPQDLVDTLSVAHKQMIYDHSADKNVTFYSYGREYFSISNDKPANTVEPSDANLILTVVCTAVVTGDETVYAIYPAYQGEKWKAEGDEYCAKMYSGWLVIPGEQEFRLYTLNGDNEPTAYVKLASWTAGSAEYTYKIPDGVGTKKAYYEGCSYFATERVDASAMDAITLWYAHGDAMASQNFSLKPN